MFSSTVQECFQNWLQWVEIAAYVVNVNNLAIQIHQSSVDPKQKNNKKKPTTLL